MTEEEILALRHLLKSEMLQLSVKSFTIKKAIKRFGISKDEANGYYLSVRSEIKKDAINKGLLYLFLGSVLLFIGLASIFGDSRLIYLSSLLLGAAGILSAFGYFVLAIKSSKTQQ
ncbi:hypothetical protein [Winogradskyella sp. MH6]|uniref:hypothetical protein n=1 Tax=Winogradskyella sp. MH6 TaxID=2929510 RepID=UPI001FB45C11|nr:hypothetical protein [Winogradskyella sp. MH6]